MNQSNDKYCISVSNLRKEYGRNKVALDNISFNVEYGKVFGFLGPNGAGKSTTIKILTTLLNPTSGTSHVFGKDITKHAMEIKKKIGVVSQQPSSENNLTVERALDLYGLLWGIEGRKRKDKVNEIIDSFDLQEIRYTKNDELSIGQKRRVQVAREFIHEMDLLFLDEPTVGLDPSARRMLLDYIKNQVKSGLTVFFTTHIMEEAEYLCDELAIINRGRIIAFDTPDGLKHKYSENNIIELKIKDITASSILPMIKTIAIDSQIEIDGLYGFKINSLNSQQVLTKIIESLTKNNIKIESIEIKSPSLEEVFLDIVNDKK
ncbi:MAG: ABC transporter ATP-binding protein [Nitrosopumilus sp.]|nr:ABC transporter ATP-binding protein [Nitrosopumilus sp.]